MTVYASKSMQNECTNSGQCWIRFLFMENKRVIEACAIGICKLLESQETIAASFFFHFTWKSVALWFSLFSVVSGSQLDNVAISIDGKVFVCLSRCSMEQSQFQFYVRDFCRFGRNTTRIQYISKMTVPEGIMQCALHTHIQMQTIWCNGSRTNDNYR